MKKKILIGIITFITSCIVFVYLYHNSIGLYINWKVWIPKPKKVITIFSTAKDYIFPAVDGNDFDVWFYDEHQIQKIKRNKNFHSVNEQHLKTVLDEYYHYLSADYQILFDKNFDMNIVNDKNNYYAYLKDEKEFHFLLLILDAKKQKLYYLLSY